MFARLPSLRLRLRLVVLAGQVVYTVSTFPYGLECSDPGF